MMMMMMMTTTTTMMITMYIVSYMYRHTCLYTYTFIHTMMDRHAGFPTPPPMDSRVTKMSVLGVTLCHNFRFSEHITEVLTTCAQSLYAMRVLRSNGLPWTLFIWSIAKFITLSRLLY